eukprot:gene7071-5009_t
MQQIILPLVLVLLLVVPAAVRALSVTFIADIHYDPDYGTSKAYGACTTSSYSDLGTAGCDAPMSLIQSAIRDVSAHVNAFTVFAGDWQRHKFPATDLPTSAVFTPLSELFASIETSGMPSTDTVNIAITLGNNDFISDYEFNYAATSQPYLEEQVTVMGEHKIQSEAEGKVFGKCGYYTKEMEGINIITLNAFLWTYSITPSIASEVEDPCGQFVYLEQQLANAAAANKKIIVLTHVPPSVNAFGVIRAGDYSTVMGNMYWKPNYQDRYSALLRQYRAHVVTHLYGHTHVFSVLAYDDLPVPGFVIPSISPVFGNTPSYLVVSFTEDWELKSIYQRYLGKDGEWKVGQTVETALDLKGNYRDMDALRESMTRMATEKSTFMNFLLLHGGGIDPYNALPGHDCDAWCRGVTVCNTLYHDFDKLKNCTASVMEMMITESGGRKTSTAEIVVVVIFLVAVVGFLCGLFFIVKRRKEKEAADEAAKEEQVVQAMADNARLANTAEVRTGPNGLAGLNDARYQYRHFFFLILFFLFFPPRLVYPFACMCRDAFIGHIFFGFNFSLVYKERKGEKLNNRCCFFGAVWYKYTYDMRRNTSPLLSRRGTKVLLNSDSIPEAKICNDEMDQLLDHGNVTLSRCNRILYDELFKVKIVCWWLGAYSSFLFFLTNSSALVHAYVSVLDCYFEIEKLNAKKKPNAAARYIPQQIYPQSDYSAYRQRVASSTTVPGLAFDPIDGTGAILRVLRGLLFAQRGVRNVRDVWRRRTTGETLAYVDGVRPPEGCTRLKMCLLDPTLFESTPTPGRVDLGPLDAVPLPPVVRERLAPPSWQGSPPLISQWAFGLTGCIVELTYENYTMPELLRMILDGTYPSDRGTAEAPEAQTHSPSPVKTNTGVVALSGFEQVGHIAHVNLSEKHIPFDAVIGQVILDCNPTVDVVVNKVDSISSVFREFKMKIIACRHRTLREVNELLLGTVRQHGCTFRIPYNRVYWNTRLCHEHTRLVDRMQPQDLLFDVMAGVGPFAIPAAKKGLEVFANDLNPTAAEYLRVNADLNHTKVATYNMDGREFMNTVLYDSVMRGPADAIASGKSLSKGPPRRRHVTMNLPAIAVQFLDVFSRAASQRSSPWRRRPGGTNYAPDQDVLLHVYCFSAAADVLADAVQQVEHHLGFVLGKENVEEVVMVRDVAPTKRMVCVSFTLPAAFWDSQETATGEEPERKMARLERRIEVNQLQRGIQHSISQDRDGRYTMRAADKVGAADLLQSVRISKRPPEEVFETIETIGKGNYGVVVKARHRESGDIVAIKQTLLAELIDVESAVKEIRVMEACHHPNVVLYYGAYRTPTALWVAMEYCDGGSIDLVRKILKQNLPEPLIAYVAHEALCGLQYMHEHHKIHRDIKAGNILFNSKGEVKLADFGITAELNHTFSRRNSSWGTFLYMAPEIHNDSDYDEKADIWSLGITVLEMAEGVLPFARLQHYPLVEFLTRKAPPALQHKDRFSPQMNVFIRRLLTQDKYLRPSAASMLEDSFLHRDYAPLREEMATLALQLMERRQELGAADISDLSSSDADATFVQRDEDAGEGRPTGVGDAFRSPAAGASPENAAMDAALQEQLLPLPLLCTEDFSFDALQYASEDTEPLRSCEICALLTRTPAKLWEQRQQSSSPAPPASSAGPAAHRRGNLQSSEAAAAGGPPQTLGYESAAPRVLLHTTKMLQHLYLYYTQLSSMRCLTKQEASTMVATRRKVEDTLGILYHIRPKPKAIYVRWHYSFRFFFFQFNSTPPISNYDCDCDAYCKVCTDVDVFSVRIGLPSFRNEVIAILHSMEHGTSLRRVGEHILFCAIVFLMVLLVAGSRPAAGDDMVWITDIHYDPEFGTPGAAGKCTNATAAARDAHHLFSSGCDASIDLVESVFQDVAQQPHVFTVFAGDLQRHRMARLPVQSVFGPLSHYFASTSPMNKTNAPPNASARGAASITLGNSDWVRPFGRSGEADYEAEGQPSRSLRQQIDVMQRAGMLSDSEGRQMCRCGFYSKRVADRAMRVLVLNTMVWWMGNKATTVYVGVADPCGQFQFLESELQDAARHGEKAILVGHAPPSVDIHASLRAKELLVDEDNDFFWATAYRDRYSALLRRYRAHVVTHLYGHTHVFSVLAYDDLPVPGFVIPSISPVYSNTPSYLVASFNQNWDLVSVTQRYLSAASGGGGWRAGETVEKLLGWTSAAYRDTSLLRKGITEMMYNDTTFNNLLLLQGGGSSQMRLPGGRCDAACRSMIVCSMLYHNASTLQACITDLRQPSIHSKD